MAINLYSHQQEALGLLKPGSILCGGVGSGKSRVSIAYYTKHCNAKIKTNGKGSSTKMKTPKDLYIITTAKKRDTLEWEDECAPFALSTNPECSISGVKVTVDSWNNLAKYVGVSKAFFIFDEQRLVGSGAWVKAFLKIAKVNTWILLSATPGDTWGDYIPVFLANKFYKNRTEFLRKHAVYNRFTKYPQIERYTEEGHLSRLRKEITIYMHYEKPTTSHHNTIRTRYDKDKLDMVMIKRWNIYKDKPIKAVSELCYLMRKVVNSDVSRISAVKKLVNNHPKTIIFYNFNYELEMLRQMGTDLKIETCEWNGHNHDAVPVGKKWIYLVQYTAGAEGWNCIETDTTIFYSQNYSYKIMVQAAGRIDRLNTTFTDLHYYHLKSSAPIDMAITNAIKKKKLFSAVKFVNKLKLKE